MTTSSTGLRSIYDNPPESKPVPVPVPAPPLKEEKPIITPIEIPVDEEIIKHFMLPPKSKFTEITEKVGWTVLIVGAIISVLISIFQLLL